MGPLQYELFVSCPVAINRMVAIFHAQFPKLEQNHIVRGLVLGAGGEGGAPPKMGTCIPQQAVSTFLVFGSPSFASFYIVC